MRTECQNIKRDALERHNPPWEGPSLERLECFRKSVRDYCPLREMFQERVSVLAQKYRIPAENIEDNEPSSRYDLAKGKE